MRRGPGRDSGCASQGPHKLGLSRYSWCPMPRRAAERYRESPVDAVIFDTDGQGSESIEAFLDMHEKAHEEGQQLLALVLLGPRQGALQGEASHRRQADRSFQAHQDEAGPGRTRPALAPGHVNSHADARRRHMLSGQPGHLLVLSCWAHRRRPAEPPAIAEAKAVAFLSAEVPRWSRENHCYSCHNNGDAARALYEASRAGIRVPAGRPGRHHSLAGPAGGLGS